MSEDGPARAAPGPDRLGSVDLNLLLPMLAVLEERSVTRAAERVGLSQPAMSHALRRLRRLFRDDLVIRQGRALALTPRALELVEPLRELLLQTADLLRFKGFDPGTDARPITVELTSSTAFVIGPRLSRLVAERAPHTTLRLRTITTPSADTFAGHGVDVVLLSEAFATEHPRERLYDDRCVLICPVDAPDLPAIDLVRTLPHVKVDTGRSGGVIPYPQLEARGIEHRVGVVVSDFVLVPYLVARSGGVALLRRRVALEMASLAPLRILDLPFPLPGLGIDMVWNPHLSDRGFIEWFRLLLFEAARDSG